MLVIPPIIPTANATIWVQSDTGAITVDPDTGNEVFTPTELIELTAFLTRDRSGKDYEREPGSKVEMVKLRGYILDAPNLPRSLSVTAKMTYLDNAGFERSGEFDFELVATPFAPEITQSVGIPIRGTFRSSEV
jgi:hypothetical protein